jgi:hypothetical protein
MLEDFRNHDAKPTEEERAWMNTNPFSVLVRLVVIAGIALAIGLSTTAEIDPVWKTASSAPAAAR